MVTGVLIAVIIIAVVGLALDIVFGVFGYKLCKRGNPWGILLWFLCLGIIGLVIGFIMIDNYKKSENINHQHTHEHIHHHTDTHSH